MPPAERNAKMKTITHPTPEKFALAISDIAAADHGITSEVTTTPEGSVVTFENGKAVKVIAGPLMAAYNL